MTDPIDPLAETEVEKVKPTPVAPYLDPFTPNTTTSTVITSSIPNERFTDDAVEELLQAASELVEENKENAVGVKPTAPGELKQYHVTAQRLAELISGFTSVSVSTYDNGEFNRTADRPSAEYVQYITGTDGRQIRTSYPKVVLPSDTEVISGRTGMQYLARTVGGGNPTKVPLWMSGIVLSLDTFKERSILELNIALEKHRVDLGNSTRGASFTGDDVLLTMVIVDFILDHVIDCSIKGWTRKLLYDRINVLDIPWLMQGALASIYPSGYPVYHVCKNVALGKCNHVIKANRDDNGNIEPDSMMSFGKLGVVDRTVLSTVMITHMSALMGGRTVAELEAYQSEVAGKVENDELVHTTDTGVVITVKFKPCSINDYSQSGRQWANSITTMVDRTLLNETYVDDEERINKRNRVLNSYAVTLDLLKHLNWISYISVQEPNDSVRVINGSDEIRESLEILSNTKGFKSNLTTAAQQYKEDSTFALIGLPNYQCPECKTGQAAPDSKCPTLIPLNMTGYFFIIMGWRAAARR